jgi:hypothetical protein
MIYDPGHEIYAEFTAAFTTPTSAASHQRIGLYDTNNGVFVGFEGTTFNITKRSGGVDVSVSNASFNKDTLTGAADSLYTRNNVPEAIDLTKFNVFRIRFGWLGVAPYLFEVLSPDGNWILFHQIYYPNANTVVSIQSTALPMTIDISKTASDATNLVMQTACWAAGTTALATVRKLGLGLTTNDSAQVTYAVPSDGIKATYVTDVVGLSAPNNATDIFTIRGSATKVIRITKIIIDATQTTASKRDVLLIKRSTANTGGTSAARTPIAYDSSSVAATATCVSYTVNPTALGTAVGTILARKLFIGTTTSVTNDSLIVDFGNRPSQAIVLRGVSEGLSINLNAITSTGNLFDISIEFTEEDYSR